MMKKIQITYGEAVAITQNRKKLNFLKGDEALQFYRDKLSIEDAFRVENDRMQDLLEKYRQIESAETPDEAQMNEIRSEIDGIYEAKKQVEITPISFSKFKEAGCDDLETIEIYGKIITED